MRRLVQRQYAAKAAHEPRGEQGKISLTRLHTDKERYEERV